MERERFSVAVNFSKYRGRYVAIVRRKIVASGHDAQKVWKEAKRKHPSERPELIKIPKGETLTRID